METAIPCVTGTGEVNQQLTELSIEVAGSQGRDQILVQSPLARSLDETHPSSLLVDASNVTRARLDANKLGSSTLQRFLETLLPTIDLSTAWPAGSDRTNVSLLSVSGGPESISSIFRQCEHPDRFRSRFSSICDPILELFQLKERSAAATCTKVAIDKRQRRPSAGRIAWDHTWGHLAVITPDDAIHCYYLKATSRDWQCSVVLRARMVRALSCLDFRPCSSPSWMLAAGCERGIAVWSSDLLYSKRQSQTAPSVASTTAPRLPSSAVRFRLLEAPGHQHVACLDWSADGRLLASGSSVDAAVLVWDIGAGVAQPLYRIAFGTERVIWSPSLADPASLFAIARHGSMFRIWSANQFGEWSSREWHRPPLDPYTMDWFSRAATGVGKSERHWLLGVPRDRPVLWCWLLDPNTRLGLRPIATVTLPKQPQKLAWDPSGQRLAIIFKEAIKERDTSSENEATTSEPDVNAQVALYVTELEPTIQLTPLGFLRAPTPSAQPMDMQWHPQFPHRSGALLAISWSSQQVTFHPCIF